jgi:hypothetical protein
MTTTSWYALPPKPKVKGYVHTEFHDDLVALIASYGALTLEWVYWLVYKEPLKGAKYRKGDVTQDSRYLHLAKQLQKLTNARAIKRSKGLRQITYGVKPIGQNFHWLDRSWMHMAVEFFCEQHREMMFEWENEREVRKKPGAADAKLYIGKPDTGSYFRIEIDRGNKDTWQLREQLLAHIDLFSEYRDKYRGTDEYRPWRVLLSTNNRRNMLGRIRRDMQMVEASAKLPNFILYTDKERYSPERPESLLTEPIWQTAHSDEFVALLRR